MKLEREEEEIEDRLDDSNRYDQICYKTFRVK